MLTILVRVKILTDALASVASVWIRPWNKPYSILVLENVVNDLKEDKLVLIRKNDELRERNMDMSHIISDLKMQTRIWKVKRAAC